MLTGLALMCGGQGTHPDSVMHVGLDNLDCVCHISLRRWGGLRHILNGPIPLTAIHFGDFDFSRLSTMAPTQPDEGQELHLHSKPLQDSQLAEDWQLHMATTVQLHPLFHKKRLAMHPFKKTVIAVSQIGAEATKDFEVQVTISGKQ